MMSFVRCLVISAVLLAATALFILLAGHLVIYFSTLPPLVRGIGGFVAATLVLAGFLYTLFGD